MACERGSASVVDYLLQHGAIKDENNSSLRIACRKGHTAVVQTLMKYNVDIRKEKEPLICGNIEIINILNMELKKSLKHREKIKILKGMDNEDLTKVILYFLLHAKQKKEMGSQIKSSIYWLLFFLNN
jgi:ankyrin repeat protein